MLPEKQTNVNKSIDGFIKMNAAFVKVHHTLSGQPSLRLPYGGPIGAVFKVT